MKRTKLSISFKKISVCIFTVAWVFSEFACSNIDCPLDNVVVMQCNLYDAASQTSLTLTDTLSIQPLGKDTILLNRAIGVNSFLLPLKETAQNDTLLLRFSNELGEHITDTLYVEHDLQPHFESIDCPASVFHNITTVRSGSQIGATLPITIDSLSLVRSLVNYDDVENIRIFLRTATQ